MQTTVAKLFTLGCATANLAAGTSYIHSPCKYNAADLIAPKEGPLFGCNSYEECDAFGNQTTVFQDFMSFTAIQLAAYAYYAEEGEYAARYNEGEKVESKPHHFFDNKENMVKFLLDDPAYDDLFDSESESIIPKYNPKNWLTIGTTKGFHFFNAKTDKSRVLGLSAMLKFRHPETVHFGKNKESRNVAAIIFRGSTVASDWKDNLDYGITEDIYKGFHGRSKSYAIPLIMRIYKMFKLSGKTIKDVLFAGHSLGGADSMISPVAIRRAVYSTKFNNTFPGALKHQVADLINNQLAFHTINIGAPKPGNANFIDAFSNELMFHNRVINDYDPVPDVPTKNILYEIREGRCPECNFRHAVVNPVKLTDFFGIENHGFVNYYRPSVYHGSGLYVSRWRQLLQLKLDENCQ